MLSNEKVIKNWPGSAVPQPTSDSAPVAKAVAPQRYLEFDYLRGIAILVIIMGHAMVNIGHTVPLALHNLIAGGSGVFVFISGFFFHRVFYPKFNYRTFIGKKTQNVFVPFLVISLVALLPMMLAWLQAPGMTAAKFMENLYWQVNDGYILYPDWYIPFIMAVFLLAPLHLRYIHMGLRAQLSILVGFSLVAMLLHRPLGNSNVLQSVVYFTPFYLGGIFYSSHLDLLSRLRRPITAVAALGLALFLLLQAEVFPHLANYHKAPFVYGGIDLMFWQKMCLSLVLLELARWLTTLPENRVLLQISRASFALFFIHPFLLNVVHGYLLPVMKTLNPGALLNISATLLALVLTTASSYWVAVGIRRLYPRHSRMLIGW